jgi:hypothetical protein
MILIPDYRENFSFEFAGFLHQSFKLAEARRPFGGIKRLVVLLKCLRVSAFHGSAIPCKSLSIIFLAALNVFFTRRSHFPSEFLMLKTQTFSIG